MRPALFFFLGVAMLVACAEANKPSGAEPPVYPAPPPPPPGPPPGAPGADAAAPSGVTAQPGDVQL